MDIQPVKVNIVGLTCEHKGMDKTEPMKLSPILKEIQVDTETDWLRRLSHRRKAVCSIKSTLEYKASAASTRRPPTPDPEDRSVSKRGWEACVQKWRRELKKLNGP